MWNIQDKKQTIEAQLTKKTADDIILLHKVYPNPVTTELTISYTLIEKAQIQIFLVASNGIEVRRMLKHTQDVGVKQETINCSGLMSGTYHLKIIAGQQIITQTIIKK
mgnify:CR=1 FL=1